MCINLSSVAAGAPFQVIYSVGGNSNAPWFSTFKGINGELSFILRLNIGARSLSGGVK